jgi:hypothetical protein
LGSSSSKGLDFTMCVPHLPYVAGVGCGLQACRPVEEKMRQGNGKGELVCVVSFFLSRLAVSPCSAVSQQAGCPPHRRASGVWCVPPHRERKKQATRKCTCSDETGSPTTGSRRDETRRVETRVVVMKDGRARQTREEMEMNCCWGWEGGSEPGCWDGRCNPALEMELGGRHTFPSARV